LTAGSVTLAWIDSRQAHIVHWRNGQAQVAHLESDVPAHRTETGFTPQDAIEGHRLEHLARFVKQVAAQLPPGDDLLLIGPGTVREHLANEVAEQDAQHHNKRRVACRAAGPLTVPQLVATLRHEIGDEPPRKPIRRRLRVTRQPSRQHARVEIQAETETDLTETDLED
jgi:hypothetical protein